MPIVRVDKTKRYRVQRAQDIAKAIARRDERGAPAPAVAPQVTAAPAPVDTNIPSAAPAAFREDTSK